MKKTLSVIAFAAAFLLMPMQLMAVEINFERPIKIGDGQTGTIPTYGPGNHIVFDGNEINVAWSAEDPWSRDDEVRQIRSDDNGESWERGDVIARGGSGYMQGLSLALGSHEGNAYRHYAFGFSSEGVFYINDRNRTRIDVTGDLGISVDDLSRSIAADQSGNAFVCFDGGGIRCSRFITDPNGVVSLDPAETALLASSSGSVLYNYSEPAIAMDSGGTLFAVWSEKIDGVWELVLAKRVGAGAWEYQIIDRQGYEGYYTSIDIADVDGAKMICVSWSWWEVVVSCTIDEGVSWDTSVVVTDEWADWRPSVAIASDGTVNVAWAYTQDDSIKFARQLKDKKGAKWEVVEVDNQYYVMDVKLALDANDLAHLVYPGKDWSTMMYTKEISVVPTGTPRP